MATEETPTPRSKISRSPGLKLVVIVVLTVVMAIPLFLIQAALTGRESTAAGAVADIASGWGGSQVVAGPVLLVPYTVQRTDVIDGKRVQTDERKTAVLLPENLNYRVRSTAETRWRGIFAVPVYRSAIQLHATFQKDALAALTPQGAQVQWKDASVAVLVSDAHGMADNVSLKVNGQTLPFEPGTGMNSVAPSFAEGGGAAIPGVRARLALNEPADLVLDTDFALRGSREFSVSPLGRRTVATVESPWPSPSFFGTFLPTDRKVTKEGFTASWTVPYLARGFGQSFATTNEAVPSLLASSFGVRFYQPVDHYQLVERSLKYAILFVALAFLVFFVVETVTRRRMHFIQYTMVGAAQVLFYLLLLSLSEHLGFAHAYLIASAATIALTSLYAISALCSIWRAFVLLAILSVLYALLYVILNQEDYALLIGSGVLFAALAGTMYFTRKIDWYRVTEEGAS
jgi:inner membrane protein